MLKTSTKVLILFITLGSVLHAQTPAEVRSPFRFGIHASPNISYISTSDPTADPAAKLKFGFGLIAEFNFADNYSFSTGIGYQFRGAEITVVDPTFDVANDPTYAGPITADYRSGFVQIPLMLKMRTRPFGYYTYFADFGGNIGISTDEQVTISPIPAKSEDYVSFMAVMFSIGVGAEYDLGGQTALLVGLYYNRSLFDNLTDEAPGDKKANTYRFDYINLKLGVLF